MYVCAYLRSMQQTRTYLGLCGTYNKLYTIRTDLFIRSDDLDPR